MSWRSPVRFWHEPYRTTLCVTQRSSPRDAIGPMFLLRVPQEVRALVVGFVTAVDATHVWFVECMPRSISLYVVNEVRITCGRSSVAVASLSNRQGKYQHSGHCSALQETLLLDVASLENTLCNDIASVIPRCNT